MSAKQASRQRADAEGWRLLTVIRSYNEAEARYLIDALTRKFDIWSRQWWLTTEENGTLDDRIEEVKAEYHAKRAARREHADSSQAA